MVHSWWSAVPHLLTCVFIFPDEPLQPSSSHNGSVPSYCRNDEGDIFLAAESWKPDVCTSCVCMDSVISCYSESCPSVSCERPVLRKGQCCPYCLGKLKKKNISSPSATKSTLTVTWPRSVKIFEIGFSD